jgi:hypothetical protein
MPNEPGAPADQPPRAVLYGLYVFLFIVLVAVFVIVGVYI